MLATVKCPNCGNVGAHNATALPRALVCSACGHRAVVRAGTPARSPTVARDEQAAERAAQARLAGAVDGTISGRRSTRAPA